MTQPIPLERVVEASITTNSLLRYKARVSKDAQTDDILIRLQKRLSRDEKHGHDLMEAFERIDRDHNGEIDVDELESCLRRLGLPIDREESKRIIQKFSTRGSSIKYKEFFAP